MPIFLKDKSSNNIQVNQTSKLSLKKVVSSLLKHKAYIFEFAIGIICFTIIAAIISHYYIFNISNQSSNYISQSSPHLIPWLVTPRTTKINSQANTPTISINQSKPATNQLPATKNTSLKPSSVNSTGSTNSSSTAAQSPVFIGSIDTMKDSRDTDYPTSQQMTESQIQQEVSLIINQNANYITDDAFYDYPTYMALWANTIHASGERVWFRPHFSCWELDNGCTVQMTPSEYISELTDFLNSNYQIFKTGDIFDPCSEPEDSNYWQDTYGNNWSWQNAPNSGTDAYNAFMIEVSQTAQTVLQQHNIYGVITNIRSTNSWWPQNPKSLYPSTIKTLGYITYDSYPEGTTTDPATAATSRITELNSIIQDNPSVPIVLGEFGYSNNVDVDDTVQAAVLNAEINAITPYSQVIGLNYWVGAGGSGYGGFTNIFSGSRGDWQARPGAAYIAKYFAQKID